MVVLRQMCCAVTNLHPLLGRKFVAGIVCCIRFATISLSWKAFPIFLWLCIWSLGALFSLLLLLIISLFPENYCRTHLCIRLLPFILINFKVLVLIFKDFHVPISGCRWLHTICTTTWELLQIDSAAPQDMCIGVINMCSSPPSQHCQILLIATWGRWIWQWRKKQQRKEITKNRVSSSTFTWCTQLVKWNLVHKILCWKSRSNAERALLD